MSRVYETLLLVFLLMVMVVMMVAVLTSFFSQNDRVRGHNDRVRGHTHPQLGGGGAMAAGRSLIVRPSQLKFRYESGTVNNFSTKDSYGA